MIEEDGVEVIGYPKTNIRLLPCPESDHFLCTLPRYLTDPGYFAGVPVASQSISKLIPENYLQQIQ